MRTHIEHAGRTFTFGRRLSERRDPRNRDFPAATSRIRSVAWTRHGDPFDQGDVGSCTGNALAGWFNTEAGGYRAGVPLLTEDDAVDLYSAGTRNDRIRGVYPPDDTGSTGPAVCKGAKRAGLLHSYSHAFGIEHMLGAMMRGPVMIGSVWLRGMMDPDPAGVVTPSGAEVGGHEYLATGYDDTTKVITFWNSWGSGWGDRGRFYMDVSDVSWLLDQRGDVTVPIL